MALDVHIIQAGLQWPHPGSYYTAHEIGEEFYRLVLADAFDDTQLARMRDYYDDVIYEGADLVGLLSELRELIPSFEQASSLRVALEEYQFLCSRAAREKKAILLFAD